MIRNLRRMRRDWDRRARENARFYVATGQKEWTDDEFLQAGETELRDHVLNDMGNICQGKDPKEMKVLEIGCGAGRVTSALGRLFGEVYAVDISREMIRRARYTVRNLSNVHLFHNNGKDLNALRGPWWRRWGKSQTPKLDFAFSCLVFQHIPSLAVIESYVRGVNQMLRPGALFKFQVQGYTECEPDFDSSWIGVAFDEQLAKSLATKYGFELRYQYGAGGQYYWLWFFKVREAD